jgi:hypothetical protein
VLLDAGADPRVEISEGVPLTTFAFDEEIRRMLGGR